MLNFGGVSAITSGSMRGIGGLWEGAPTMGVFVAGNALNHGASKNHIPRQLLGCPAGT